MKYFTLALVIVIVLSVGSFLPAFGVSNSLSQRISIKTPVFGSTGGLKGTFTGTYKNQYGMEGIFSYSFTENDYIFGGLTPNVEPTAFGSYSLTNLKIEMRARNTINNSYYYFTGTLSCSGMEISGTYTNLTTPSETGPFILKKVEIPSPYFDKI